MQIPEQCRLPMTPNDIKTGQEMMKEDFIKSNPAWLKVRFSGIDVCQAAPTGPYDLPHFLYFPASSTSRNC